MKPNQGPAAGARIDGLGICRLCIHLEEVSKDWINIGSEDFYDTICPFYKLPCYLTRKSLSECKGFKNYRHATSLQTICNLLSSLPKCLVKFSWKPLKETIDNELQN